MKSALLKFFITWHLVAVVCSRKLGHSAVTAAKKWQTLTGNPTTIIGHRGEKVLMPEHTVGSYEVACIEGADYVEPDLVLTKDLELICYHDLTLKDGTNIAEIPELQYLKRNFSYMNGPINVTIIDDWIIPDLNLTQIKMLKVVQKNVGVRPQYFNALFEIPTFEQYLDVVHKMSHKMKLPIGIIPELKHPDFINTYLPNIEDFYMENKTLEVLKTYGYPLNKTTDQGSCRTRANETIECGHVVIQSFDKRSLEYLNTKTDIELMMLVDDDATLLTRKSLEHIAQFATYYAVWKEYLYNGVEPVLKAKEIDYDMSVIEELGGFIPKENFTAEVHASGMLMGIYTLYDSREPSYMGCSIECRVPENKTFELYYYFGLGVDAMFVENIKEATDLRLQYAYSLTGDGAVVRTTFSVLVTSILVLVANYFL